jgi:hypothetical protein
MKKIFLAFISLFILLSGIKAQCEYIKPHDINELSSRRLIVVIEQPEDLIKEKLTKKKVSTDVYAAAIDSYNKNFQEAITKFWKISRGDIEFKTLDEINRISDKKNYAIIYCRTAKQIELDQSYAHIHGILWWGNFSEVVRDRDFVGKMTVLGISLLDKFSMPPIYQCPVPDVFPSQADLDYVLGAVSNYITYRNNHRHLSDDKMDETMLKDNQPELKDKVLLLRRDLLDKKIANAALISKIYPFPYLITSKDSIDQAIESADEKYAIAIVAPYDLDGVGTQLEYVQYAYSPDDGLILGSSGLLDMPSAENAGNGTTLKPLITKKCLMDFCQYINKKDKP